MGNAATTTLQPLDVGALHVGLKLPGPLYNKRGRVLKRAGAVLTEEHVELLSQETLMVDAAWGLPRPEPAADNSIEQLVKGIKDGKTGAENRRYRRRRWEASVRIKLEERTDGESVPQELSVRTNDLSQAGFSFKFNRPVPNDSIIRVQFTELPNRPRAVGAVRNSVLLEDGMYRVGVEFTGTERA